MASPNAASTANVPHHCVQRSNSPPRLGARIGDTLTGLQTRTLALTI
jgi:hypothetical protein